MPSPQPIPSNDNAPRAEAHRQQARGYAPLTHTTRSLKDASRYRKMAAAYAASAREEDWLAANSDHPQPLVNS